jgi:lipopolysaccharide/colanic/teichoic acid biosynthesis glycosyltransferase
LPTQLNLRLVDPGTVPAPPEAASARSRRERAASARGAVRPLRHPWYPAVKGALDRMAAAALATVALPVVALAALVVKLTSRGPAFYTQTRVGRDGHLFTIYKIRTMIHNCESLTGPRWSIPGDPRVTRFGRFLRLSHLDELPQLLNVLRGDMSLIGPRPERPEFLPELERFLPAYRQRLAVRPGVTGLAQVQLPPDTDMGSVRHKLAYDLYYIRNLSPWLDVRLLAGTAFYALGLPFRLVARLVGLPGSAHVEEDVRDLLAEPAPARPRLSA